MTFEEYQSKSLRACTDNQKAAASVIWSVAQEVMRERAVQAIEAWGETDGAEDHRRLVADIRALPVE